MNQIHPRISEIRQRRQALKISQKALAAAAGISSATLEFLERGFTKDPRISTIDALESVLKNMEAEQSSRV